MFWVIFNQVNTYRGGPGGLARQSCDRDGRNKLSVTRERMNAGLERRIRGEDSAVRYFALFNATAN
jgi:hypothetical protein